MIAGRGWRCTVLLYTLFCKCCWAEEPPPSLAQLAELSSALMGLRFHDAKARKMFPLGDPRVQAMFAKAISEEMIPAQRAGLMVVLYAHGAQGFLWGLDELARTDAVTVRANLIISLSHFTYREAYLFYISLLDDKREFVPITWKTLRYARLREGPWPGPLGEYVDKPLRICDHAASFFCDQLFLRRELPENLRSVLYAARTTEEKERRISILKDWWAKEGERYITATRPSVVEVLLKEAEERSKQAELGAQGAKADEKPKGEVGDGALPAGPKAIEKKESKPEAKEPSTPETEKKEPEKK